MLNNKLILLYFKTVYTFSNATADLRFLQLLPFEGYRWRIKIKFFERKENHLVKEVICMDVNLLVTSTSTASSRKLARPNKSKH